MSNKHIIINWDLDGVLADFQKHALNTFGKTASDFSQPKDFWDMLATEQEFYRHMPVFEDMKTLFKETASKPNVTTRIITGRPRKDTFPLAECHKREWVLNKLGFGGEVIVCLARHKQNHLLKNDIPLSDQYLIDDTPDNTIRWSAVGGTSHLHTDYKTTKEFIGNLFD